MTDQIETPGAVATADNSPNPDTSTQRFAIFREVGTPSTMLRLTWDGQTISCELSAEGPDAEFLRTCLADLKASATATKGEERLNAIAAVIREKVESQGFKIERLPDADVQVHFGIDLQSGRTFGKHEALHPFAQADDGIGRSIQKAIQQAFDRPAEEHAESIRSALSEGNHQEAARLVIGQKDRLVLFARSRTLLDAICAIDRQALEPTQANEIANIVVGLASGQHRDEIACSAAEQLLEHDPSIDKEMRFGLKNMVAVAALKRGEKETGRAMLRELLEQADEIDAVQRGWIWRNLSMALDPDDPEARRTARHAIDAFLEAGDKQEASRSIAQLSHLQEHDQPISAISQFDQMLELMSNEGVLDDEIRANILHRKARKLLEFGNSPAAAEAARQAVELRRGILGAEEGLISSLHLAAIAAASHGDKAVADVMGAEARRLETETGSAHYAMARRVSTLLETWNSEEAKLLLEEAEKTKEPEVYAAIHVATANYDPSLTPLQKLGRLERALQELDRRGARPGAKHAGRLAVAQILKEQGRFDRAADWYRKILADEPLDAQAAQFLVDALWRAEEWGDAAIFLKKNLDTVGERPGVTIAYGRSLLEAGQLSEAVQVLTRALKLAEGNPALLQNIRTLRDRALELGGSIPPRPTVTSPDAPVILDELRAALKEFSAFVSASKRMDFWEKPDGEKKHKWRKRPEMHGQTLLHTYLKATFKERVDIFEEIGVGAGRLDLLVRFIGGVSAIIELKMCGRTYSTEYARSGEDQIEHYMTNRKVHMGFLVTFDARQRNNGSRLVSRAIGPENTIEETTIDVRPTITSDETSD